MLHLLQLQPLPAHAGWSAYGRHRASNFADGWDHSTGLLLAESVTSSSLPARQPTWFQFHPGSTLSMYWVFPTSCLLSCFMAGYDFGLDRELILCILKRLDCCSCIQTTYFEHNSTWLNHSHIIFNISFTRTHAGFRGLVSERLGRE